MLGVSGLITNDGGATVAESGGARSGSSEVCASAGMGEIERSGGCGSRWPRQETLALLKIRSAMDVAFRDASLKGPLWEEVSRKMGELGFQRSAKKCKEKFENVYKYHKRTKDGRSSKPDGKNYRFFDQLAALENAPPPPRPQPPATTIMAAPPNAAVPKSHDTISSTSSIPLSVVPPEIIANPINSSSFQPPLMQPPFPAHQCHGCHLSHRPISTSPASNTKSFSTSSDEDIRRRQGRKRKWKDYFERLMKDVVQKQEELQKKLLEAWEKREKDRIAREEAWRVQEMARMNREYDNLVADRSIAAVKDVAVIAFLQKLTMQVDQEPENQHPPQLLPPPPPPELQQSALPPPPELPAQPPPPTKIMEMSNRDNGSSRWPKAEVEALIKIRTGLDVKYHDNGPKGPLWEEISKSMAKLGYKRNAKRCKEKWENINKYFKKVKESNKKRPEDAKTCPYFHQLDAIYTEKAKNNLPLYNPGYGSKPENPIMDRPDQQKNNPVLHDGGHNNDTMRKDDEDEEDEVGEYEIEAAISADKLDEVRATGSCG